jgi:hypothetical protein
VLVDLTERIIALLETNATAKMVELNRRAANEGSASPAESNTALQGCRRTLFTPKPKKEPLWAKNHKNGALIH